MLGSGLYCVGQARSNTNTFAFIENSMDSSALVFIKTYRSTSKDGEDLTKLYHAIKQKAINQGANCFRLKNFSRDSTTGTMALILSTYHGDQAFIERNAQKREKNTVYILSDGDFSSKSYTFKINGVKREIKSGSFFKHKIEEKGSVKINKGGFFGTTVYNRWVENGNSKFYSLSGFGLVNSSFGTSISPMNYGRPGVGVSFTTGKLNLLNENIGFLMTRILKEQKD
jgi:hypothetical protein